MNYPKRLPFLVVAAIAGGAVFLSPVRADDARPDAPTTKAADETVMRVYDIRALVRPVQDFPLETSPHGPSFVAPANRPEAANESSPSQQNGGAGAGLFSDASHKPDPPAPSEAAAVDLLMHAIEAAVAPDSWSEAGGRLGMVSQLQGKLVITQTPANHKLIEAMLHQLAEQRGQTLRTTAEWLLLPHAEVSKLLKVRGAADKTHPALHEVDPAAMDKLPATVRRFHAELLSQNGQVVHYVSGHERSETVNVSPTVGTDVSALTPIVQNLGAGIALQVNPLADLDQHKAIVTIFSTYNDPDKPSRPAAQPVGEGNHIASAAPGAAATQPAKTSPDVSTAYHHPSGIVQELRTSVRLPMGVPVMVGSMTLEPVAGNADSQELVLILTIQLAE